MNKKAKGINPYPHKFQVRAETTKGAHQTCPCLLVIW